MQLLKSLIPITASLVLAACGGGDSDSDFSIVDGNTEAGGSASTDTNTTTEASLALGTGVGSSFQSGALDITTSSLSAGGGTGVTVNIVDTSSNALFTNEATVSFTSTCAGQTPAKASIEETITTSAGVATANYQAQGCTGQDTITATLPDGNSANGVITVAPPVIGAIEFTSATPSTVALAGFGSSTLPETSTVIFKAVDENGNAVNGQTVNFSLSSTLGGISLSPTSGVSDTNGLARTTLNSGSVNTTVRIIASLTTNSRTISTTSDPIAINSGLPDQNSFSDSAVTLNPRGGSRDGGTVSINIRAADQFNNPVPDGTSISFITNGGSIDGSCKTSGGGCSATWTSQDPRPADGIARILIRSTGQESYTDSNSNGVYDVGEPILTSLDEAFLDLNDNDSWDPGEFFSDFNNDGLFSVKADASKYQGASCSEDAKNNNHCVNLVEVRQQLNLCMSSDSTLITNFPTSVDLTTTSSFTIKFSDVNGLTPASGTTISITTDNGEIISGASPIIPNECKSSGFVHTVVMSGDGVSSAGKLTIKVTQADGLEKPKQINITD